MTEAQIKAMIGMLWGANQDSETSQLAQEAWREFNQQPWQVMSLSEAEAIVAKSEGRVQ